MILLKTIPILFLTFFYPMFGQMPYTFLWTLNIAVSLNQPIVIACFMFSPGQSSYPWYLLFCIRSCDWHCDRRMEFRAHFRFRFLCSSMSSVFYLICFSLITSSSFTPNVFLFKSLVQVSVFCLVSPLCLHLESNVTLHTWGQLAYINQTVLTLS